MMNTYRLLMVLVLLISSFTFGGNEFRSTDSIDKMYNDILRTLSSDQRALIEKYKSGNSDSSTEKRNSEDESQQNIESKDQKTVLPEKVNQDIEKMILQIDTMRQKRLMHFRTDN